MRSTRIKQLIRSSRRPSGRNFSGKITLRRRGGGVRRFSRIVSIPYSLSSPLVYQQESYDPCRSSRLSLVRSSNNSFSYIISPKFLRSKTFLSFGPFAKPSPGSALPLKFMSLGTRIYNLQFSNHPLSVYSTFCLRAAGTSGHLISKPKYSANVLVKLPSGEFRFFYDNSYAQIGTVSNRRHNRKVFLKAGSNRLKGLRPAVRGESMNPVDHPHGGKTRGGRHPVSFSSVLSHGFRTRSPRKRSSFIFSSSSFSR